MPGSTGTSVSAPSIVKRGRRAFSAGDLMLICDHSELTFRNALIAQPSCITNMSCGLSATPRSHAEELESTRLVEEKFERLVCGLVRRAGRG